MNDLALIKQYINERNEKAFLALYDRHHLSVKKTIDSMCRNSEDVEDLVQQSWVKIIQALATYTNNGSFAGFAATIARNTVRDYWRYSNTRSTTLSETHFMSENFMDSFESSAVSVEDAVDSDRQMKNLFMRCIPRLPVKLRTVFLLRHEAEYWDGKQRLSWEMLALFTQQSKRDAWKRFDRIRSGVLIRSLGYDSIGENVMVDSRDVETFALWTQAQRPSELKKVTETELANLLGVPLNTFKTRYRSARGKIVELMQEINAHTDEVSA